MSGTPEPVPAARRSRLGRPARISRQKIAEAAHARGLDGLTLRDVADDLGVSIAALYHHVSSKDDLVRLAAEYSAARVPLPVDRGQHWAVWLYEWAVYNRDAFLAQPGLLARYLEGAIPVEAIATNLESILAALVRQGFTLVEANDAYEVVSASALGTIAGIIRERALASGPGGSAESFRRVLSAQGPDALPHLRRLLDDLAVAGRAPFHARIATVLRGIAVRQGDDPAAIDGVLAEAAAT